MFIKKDCVSKIKECTQLIEREIDKEFVDTTLINGCLKQINIMANRISTIQRNRSQMTPNDIFIERWLEKGLLFEIDDKQYNRLRRKHYKIINIRDYYKVEEDLIPNIDFKYVAEKDREFLFFKYKGKCYERVDIKGV